jgi:hypothetical protein
MADWTPTEEDMPPEGVVVEAITPGGEYLRLKWQNRLWHYADGPVYLYFTPTWWRQAGSPGLDRVAGTGSEPAQSDTWSNVRHQLVIDPDVLPIPL